MAAPITASTQTPQASQLPLNERIHQLLRILETDMYERETALRLGLLAAFAGESLFMLGPPGVAKSLVARRLKHAFAGAKAFEYLMNRFSTPDEIFGPVSITKLTENDSYERLTDAYLPGAEIVFLDEIWKAGPAIQNTLLTVLNEKVYRNGAQEIKVPMRLLVAASNELPAEGEGLEALYDRFLIRLLVGPLQDDKNFLQMITGDSKPDIQVPAGLAFTQTEFDALRQQLQNIQVPPDVQGMILALRQQIADHNRKLQEQAQDPEAQEETPLYISDRRWKKAIGLLRASALMHGRNRVVPADCFVLPHVLWDRPEQHELIAKWIEEAIRDKSTVSGVDLASVEAGVRSFCAEVKKEIEREEVFEQKEKIVYANHFYKIIEEGAIKNLYVLKSEYDALAALIPELQNHLNKLQKFNINQMGRPLDEPLKTNVKRSLFKKIGAKPIQLYRSPADKRFYLEVDILVDEKDSCKFTVNNGKYVIEHKVIREKRTIKRAPNPCTLKAWDDQVNEFRKQLDQAQNLLSQQGAQIAGTTQGHLFATAEHQKSVAEDLSRSQNQLDKLKSTLMQIVSYYTNV